MKGELKILRDMLKSCNEVRAKYNDTKHKNVQHLIQYMLEIDDIIEHTNVFLIELREQNDKIWIRTNHTRETKTNR